MWNPVAQPIPETPGLEALDTGASLELHTADSAPALLDSLRQGGARLPALILIDASQPSGRHEAAFAALKADPDLRAVPVVLFTPSRAQAAATRILNAGGSTYLTRSIPFRWLPDLLKTLDGETVVILTPETGGARAYNLGGRYYLARPAQIVHWMDLLHCLGKYWSYEMVEVSSGRLAV